MSELTEIEVFPWFGGNPIKVHPIEGTDDVAYTWSRRSDKAEGDPVDIADLLLWHDCPTGERRLL